jgi:gamma-glutamyltranspeptidase/glutathione hydrolase
LTQGAICAGHEKTADAAAAVLEAGGNAFDAVVAAVYAACVAEPVLASLGGGGFLLAWPRDTSPVLYDFFTQTPRQQRPAAEVDFKPIVADFGDAQQEFHIGLGAAATPGLIPGLFRVHRELCRLPLDLLIQPACEMARNGVRLNRFQHYISTIVEPILRASPEAFAMHRSAQDPERLADEGSLIKLPQFADTLEALSAEGETLFSKGELGQTLVQACREQGGHLDATDLREYRVERRAPLRLRYRDVQLLTNPPPSVGGLLIGFTLACMGHAKTAVPAWGSAAHLSWTARAMQRTQRMREESRVHERLPALEHASSDVETLYLKYLGVLGTHPPASRGTTHISVLDRFGNLASLTLSNGEGCGYVLPRTGIMVNNMLGEEDLNPGGFHRWPPDRRIASMMAPTALRFQDGTLVATGSGGSNRIRSAILQVVSHLVDFGMDVGRAVTAPRIHFESGLLNLEPPRPPAMLQELEAEFPRQRVWGERNLFFGGAHTALRHPDGRLDGRGDPRRGGVCRLVPPPE